jgi:hypothetical protein
MKLLIKIAIVIVVILVAWNYWPGSASSALEFGSNNNVVPAAQAAATGEKSQSAGSVPQVQPTATTTQTTTEHLCSAPDALEKSLQQLQQQRVSLTNQLIDLHIKLGIQKPVTLQALQAVGGDLEVFQFRQSAQKDSNYPYFKKDITPVSINENTFLRMEVARAKEDYNTLLQIIQQHPKDERHRLFAYTEQSLLGALIIKNPQLPFSVIQQFIDAGIQPFLGDLAAFTALDLPLPLIDMVQQHFKGDLQQQWQDNFRHYNLTLLAAENGSAELFDYWRDLGVPASLNTNAPNAFDLIPLPQSAQQLERQLNKVRTLLSAGILPRAADSRSQWLLLLPPAESGQLAELLQQQAEIPFDETGPDTALLLSLKKLQSEFNQLLQQVATCPKAQQWSAGLTTTRDMPERFYLKRLQQQQKPSPHMKELSEQDIDNIGKIRSMGEKKDWQGVKSLMLQMAGATPENTDHDLLLMMLLLQANPEDLKRQLSQIHQLNEEHAKSLAQIASPAVREQFKAAGLELPYNAEAAKRHQQLLELQQRMKKSEQRRAETKQ